MEKIHFRAEVPNTGTFRLNFLSLIRYVFAPPPTHTHLDTCIPLFEFSEVRERGREKTKIYFVDILEHLNWKLIVYLEKLL